MPKTLQRTQRHSPAKEQAKDKRDKKETRERQTRENKREGKLEGKQGQKEKGEGKGEGKGMQDAPPKGALPKATAPEKGKGHPKGFQGKGRGNAWYPPNKNGKNGNPKSGTSPSDKEPRTTECPNPVSKVSNRAKDTTGEKPSPTLKSPTGAPHAGHIRSQKEHPN